MRILEQGKTTHSGMYVSPETISKVKAAVGDGEYSFSNEEAVKKFGYCYAITLYQANLQDAFPESHPKRIIFVNNKNHKIA